MVSQSISKIVAVILAIFVLLIVIIALGLAFKEKIFPYFKGLIGIENLFLGVLRGVSI